MPLLRLADLAPFPGGPKGGPWPFVALAILLLGLVLVIARLIRRRASAYRDPEAGLGEDLSDYPPAPPGAARLAVNGVRARVRLVVVAPVGRASDPIAPDDVPGLLGDVCPGLSAVLAVDKPRIKVWPPPLSTTGFGPTFHRLVHGADPQWLKLAGPARTGQGPILLGLVVWVENASGLGDVVVESTEWGELLQVQ